MWNHVTKPRSQGFILPTSPKNRWLWFHPKQLNLKVLSSAFNFTSSEEVSDKLSKRANFHFIVTQFCTNPSKKTSSSSLLDFYAAVLCGVTQLSYPQRCVTTQRMSAQGTSRPALSAGNDVRRRASKLHLSLGSTLIGWKSGAKFLPNYISIEAASPG